MESIKKRHYRQLTRTDRIKLESLLRVKCPKSEIAKILQVNPSTVYREIKRGEYTHRNSDWTEEVRYSSDLADRRYRENLAAKGGGLKIGNDIALAEYIENKIVDEKYSPEAALGAAAKEKKSFKVSICKTTLYNYINDGLFLRLTNKNLPVKGKRKQKYNKVIRVAKTDLAGESIEKRPEEILKREEFGHWEMDTVKGKKRSKRSLLVLSERKTRKEIIVKLRSHTADAVVEAVDNLEREWGSQFSKIFRSITVDNGKEFSNCKGLELSAFDKSKKRTKLYYCHPYSSWERGTNEVQNKLIRRHIPKGTDFDEYPIEEITRIEAWINNYPRHMFGFETANDRFQSELMKLA